VIARSWSMSSARDAWGGRERGDEDESRFPEVFPRGGVAIKIARGERNVARVERWEG